jgi:hypothetical protein
MEEAVAEYKTGELNQNPPSKAETCRLYLNQNKFDEASKYTEEILRKIRECGGPLFKRTIESGKRTIFRSHR